MLAVASFQCSVKNKTVEGKLAILHFISKSFRTGGNKVLCLFCVCHWDVL